MLNLRFIPAFAMALTLAVGAASAAERVRKFSVFRPSGEGAGLAAGHLRLTYSGPIIAPFAEQLAALWQAEGEAYSQVELEIDSSGGSLSHAVKVIAVLREIRRTARLVTVVTPGSMCASACVPVYMQGEVRRASTATGWMFHGACGSYTNVPSPVPTRLYASLLAEAGLDAGFLCELEDKGYLSKPGAYWVSGYELYHLHAAGVITEISGGWQPAEPVVPPFDPAMGGPH